MKKIDFAPWKKLGFEFLSIFIAVISAFALNNWNDNRNADKSESKILIEIANGLEKDLEDIKQNEKGHKQGISACKYFRDAMSNKNVTSDSLMIHYNNLTRDYISIQNTAGYQTLKSRGLELIKNDSLRLKIISLYEFDYQILRKLEEEYYEMQFHKNYFKEINKSILPNFNFDENNMISGVNLPLKMPIEEKKILLMYLLKIQGNRNFILSFYAQIENKITEVQKSINQEIKH